MANHRKFKDSTMITLYWSKGDVLYLDSMRGEMSRGEYLSACMHLSKKDKVFIKRLEELEKENLDLRQQANQPDSKTNEDILVLDSDALETIRDIFFEKNKDVLVKAWIDNRRLNWKKITLALKYKKEANARKYIEQKIKLLGIEKKAKNTVSSFEQLYPGAVVRGVPSEKKEIIL